ncbi:unnamed protein product, partial [Sphacelaria rigidula]
MCCAGHCCGRLLCCILVQTRSSGRRPSFPLLVHFCIHDVPTFNWRMFLAHVCSRWLPCSLYPTVLVLSVGGLHPGENKMKCVAHACYSEPQRRPGCNIARHVCRPAAFKLVFRATAPECGCLFLVRLLGCIPRSAPFLR